MQGSECLSVCTRSLNIDYAYKGTCDGNFYQTLRDTPEWSNLPRLIDTTLPAVLYLAGHLFVSGIPTSRLDKSGTPIRWSFHWYSASSAKWFAPLVEAFRTGRISEFGERLDMICGPAAGNRDFKAPSIEKFIECLPTEGAKPDREFALWSAFCPTDEEELKDYIGSLPLPPGEVTIVAPNGEKCIRVKKKRFWIVPVPVVVAVILIVAAGIYATKGWNTSSPLSSQVLENISSHSPKSGMESQTQLGESSEQTTATLQNTKLATDGEMNRKGQNNPETLAPAPGLTLMESMTVFGADKDLPTMPLANATMQEQPQSQNTTGKKSEAQELGQNLQKILQQRQELKENAVEKQAETATRN